MIEPVPDTPAAVARIDEERVLIIADYHAGFEVAMRYEGVELDSRAGERRDRVMALIDQTGAERVVILGDFAHWIGEPVGLELEELETFVAAVTDRVSLTVVKGNHDGKLDSAIDLEVTPTDGVRIGNIGFVHGHTHPSPEVLRADAVCVGHEHVQVRLEDYVGGARKERAWLRGALDPAGFDDYDDPEAFTGQLIVFPAFNNLVGGTYVNLPEQAFLSPFLPAGLRNAEIYLLDGTRLGALDAVA